MYQAMVFDLFGTLVEGVSSSIYQQMAELLGISETIFTECWRKDYSARITGKRSTEESLRLVCSELGMHVDDRIVRAFAWVWTSEVQRCLKSVRPEATDVLTTLRNSHVSIGLLSNASPEVVVAWRGLPLTDYFTTAIFSCSVGMMKPDPGIYDLICDRLRVTPEQCLFVGDGGDDELAGAASVGMTPIQVKTECQASSKANRVITNLSEVLTFL